MRDDVTIRGAPGWRNRLNDNDAYDDDDDDDVGDRLKQKGSSARLGNLFHEGLQGRLRVPDLLVPGHHDDYDDYDEDDDNDDDDKDSTF